MCFMKKPKVATPQKLPEPEKPADPLEVGSARKAEDEQLFGEGGTPQTRVDRTAAAGVGSTGTGLKMV